MCGAGDTQAGAGWEQGRPGERGSRSRALTCRVAGVLVSGRAKVGVLRRGDPGGRRKPSVGRSCGLGLAFGGRGCRVGWASSRSRW